MGPGSMRRVKFSQRECVVQCEEESEANARLSGATLQAAAGSSHERRLGLSCYISLRDRKAWG